MKIERFEEIKKEKKIETGKWYLFDDIKRISLNNGREIFPDWLHSKFLIDDKNNILIKYGDSVPYGALLSNIFRVSIGYKNITFRTFDTIKESKYYDSFRFPEAGDVLVVKNGNEEAQVFISKVEKYPDVTMLELVSPIKITEQTMLSFYCPNLRKEESTHEKEFGIYMNFEEKTTKKDKKFGGYNEKIKLRKIKEIII